MDSAWPFLTTGDRLLADGRGPEAVEAYRRAVEAEPTLAEAHRRLGLALYRQGDLDHARHAAEAAAALSPELVEPWFTLGLILRDLRDVPCSLAAFDRVLGIQRDHREALHHRGRVLYDSGHAEEALASLQRAAELSPDSAAVVHDLAIAHLACGNWREAEAALARCTALDPGNPETYYELGHAHEYDVATPDEDAESAYRRAVELDPEHLPAQFRLAVLRARRRRADPLARAEALEALRRLAGREDLSSHFPDAHLVFYLLGTLLDDGEATRCEAIEAYQRCLALRPTFAPAHNNLGVLARQTGDYEGAADHFGQAVVADPGYDPAVRNLCRLLYDQPNELAVRELREIVDRIPSAAPDVIACMMGHVIDAAKSEAYASSYDRVHEIKNLIGVLGARMRKVCCGEGCRDQLQGAELLEMQTRAFDAIRGYLGAIETTSGERETLDCGEVLRMAVRQMAVTKPAGVEVEYHISPGLPQLTGDRRRLTQLFRNLTVNAFEAMPETGTLRVLAELIRASEAPAGSPVRAGVRIVFEDTGPGMTEEELRRAFDPGFTTKPTGSGYGLAVVSQVVREHGGTVALTRGEAGGARATVELPERARPEAATSRLRLRPVIYEDWRKLIQAEVDAIRTDDGNSVRRDAPDGDVSGP